ncbi:MAG: phosphatidylinositol kinase [Zetaproteobacteria bacterium CG_4_9_14_3_um_filter_49_83]|nr:MAG: phosphatidylinositol kinase [Zetaproteobacteria bacterium CG1_02_49_23]PIQ34413.1 MAG: phosphatidylinositol kinase [Zetaproteobacteria bacterium CG17_big_fil_post_rev_8_21_14_2_50_50_13]PIV30521.1 MAG: phosphatidylinositol kinase [Zetaproteobacteria bacterium CG02_land_8_20_14_3_00_50_9]PIY56397.1 MAG: phosphatidylinositol kinase [Zetaproteobacteria bacterium CG_4_10_14_0_8_um_filter_49_80]PJA34037.1 MAG: phosphatidylinositol kinase [Zetaproteobacteria bacterium CG_4_9_14_3_um_filter_49
MGLSIRDYLSRGPATSKEIQAATGLSQAAVSRQLRGMENSIVVLPSGRSPRYVITRNAFGGDDKLPLFMVDAHGNNAPVANIRPLAHGGFFIEALTGMPSVLSGAGKNGLYDDLPYFLDDLRPQGFLGRQIAEEMASQSDDFPSDPSNWNANHVGRYLVSNGDDLPGNFKFGQQAHLRVRRKPESTSPEDYPELAKRVMSGGIPGSSAGGEQPKFTAYCAERSAHVIVKFSPLGDNEVARRWRDILITEFHATEAIHHTNHPAAETRLIEMDGRLFLESQRFDRTGEFGRLPMLSLQSVDAEFTGLGSDWPKVMTALHQEQLVSWAHVVDVALLWAFGKFINNTDMHLGNLSLGIEGSVFRLLPVYDMCSMGFSPRGGEVLPYAFTPPDLKGLNIETAIIEYAKRTAQDFWNRVASDVRISDEFKEFLSHGNPINRDDS